MKIISETPDQLVASDKSQLTLAAGPVALVVGLLVLILARNLVVGVLGLLVMAVGAYLIVTRQVRTVTADKPLGKISIQAKSILRKRLDEYLFHDITKVQLMVGLAPIVNNGPGQTPGVSLGGFNLNLDGITAKDSPIRVHLMLVLNNGTLAEVASGNQTPRFKGWLNDTLNTDVGVRLAAFMGLPFESADGVPVVGDIVAQAVVATAATAAVAASPAPPVEPPQPPAPPQQ